MREQTADEGDPTQREDRQDRVEALSLPHFSDEQRPLDIAAGLWQKPKEEILEQSSQ